MIQTIPIIYKNPTIQIAQYQPNHTLSLRRSNDDIARLLTDHISWYDDIEPRNFGENAGIYHTKSFDTTDLEIAIEHGVWVIVSTNGTRTTGMVAPCFASDEIFHLGLRLSSCSRPGLFEVAIEGNDVCKSAALTESLVEVQRKWLDGV